MILVNNCLIRKGSGCEVPPLIFWGNGSWSNQEATPLGANKKRGKFDEGTEKVPLEAS